MIRRRIGYAVWLLLAVCLYFFENNTGTRIVLVCTLLLPFIPVIRRSLFENGAVREEGKHAERRAKNGKYAEMWHKQADSYSIGEEASA